MHPEQNNPSERDTLLDEAVAAYLQAEAEGAKPDRREWLARYQELTAELEDFFADRDRVHRLLAPLHAIAEAVRSDTLPIGQTGRTQPGPGDRESPLAALLAPDYELLGCLGQGGMGVVYKARQRSLGRLVALKMIRLDALTSPAEVSRFRNEAEFIAQLDHPGIVPVYEVGESEGQPFFTMKLIEGGSLLAQLDRFVADPRAAAVLLANVAQAIHHAHQRGILHRDLKPSNILLDADGQPLVTDFGLAKRVAPIDDDALTLSRTIVGTPSYLAPEQTRGQRGAVTTAADVYGLGAILYALLTGQPPFTGESVLDTLEQVRSQEPVPPRRLRPQVPRDLETICLKCLAKEPAQRYASAAHLAEDLGRFLEGKSIQARPAGPVRRLVKWARRRPALAGLIGVTLLAVLVVGVLSANHQRQLELALEQAQTNADEARRRKEEATANYRQARATINQMLDRIRVWGDVPRLVELRRQQQEDALAFLLQAARQQGDEPEVLSDVAQARELASQLQHALGQHEAARANEETARDLLARLVERFPEEASYQARLAYAWMTLGVRHQEKDERMASLQRALGMYEALAARGVDVGRSLAMAHHNLADALNSQEKQAAAEAHWRKAVALHARLHQQHPEASPHRLALAQTQLSLSLLLQGQTGRLAEATQFHDQAESNLEQLLRADPNHYDSILELALLRVNWSYVLLRTGKAEMALADLNRNEQLLQKVLAREPNLVGLRDRLFRTYGVRATILEKQGRLAEALADYEQVVALSPPMELDNHRVTLAALRGNAGDHARAVADAETLARELPETTSWKRYYTLARTCANAIRTLEKDRTVEASARPAQADRYAASAMQLLDRARAAAPAAEWQKQVVRLHFDFHPLAGREAFRQWLKGKPSANPP